VFLKPVGRRPRWRDRETGNAFATVIKGDFPQSTAELDAIIRPGRSARSAKSGSIETDSFAIVVAQLRKAGGVDRSLTSRHAAHSVRARAWECPGHGMLRKRDFVAHDAL